MQHFEQICANILQITAEFHGAENRQEEMWLHEQAEGKRRACRHATCLLQHENICLDIKKIKWWFNSRSWLKWVATVICVKNTADWSDTSNTSYTLAEYTWARMNTFPRSIWQFVHSSLKHVHYILAALSRIKTIYPDAPPNMWNHHITWELLPFSSFTWLMKQEAVRLHVQTHLKA